MQWAPALVSVGLTGGCRWRARRYALPKALREYKLVCAGADKPLVAAALLQQLGEQPTIVFTASVEATRRCRYSAVPSRAFILQVLSKACSHLAFLAP